MSAIVPRVQEAPSNAVLCSQREDSENKTWCWSSLLLSSVQERFMGIAHSLCDLMNSVAAFIMRFRRLHFLPGALFLLVMVTFAATYGIAVWKGHVEPGFPYISDTGSLPPESCIFAQFINIAAFLLLLCVYIRYLQIEEVTLRAAARGVSLPRRLNLLAALLGSASCVGLDIVANFQESNVLIVHMIGAFICFFSGTTYFCLQTYISRQLMPEVTTPLAFFSRLVISALCNIFTILTVVCGSLALQKFNGELSGLSRDEFPVGHLLFSRIRDDVKKWKPENAGWSLHLVSTISEWLLVMCFCGFIVSFSREFRGLVLEGPFLRVLVPDETGEPDPLHKP